MKFSIFIPGIIVFLISFIIWSYDQPKVDLFSSGFAQLALLNEENRKAFMSLQEEVFYAKIGMAFGAIIIILGVVLGRNRSSSFICVYCKFALSSEAELINHINLQHEKELVDQYKKTTEEKKIKHIRRYAVLKGIVIGTAGAIVYWLLIYQLSSLAYTTYGTGMEPYFFENDLLVKQGNFPFNNIKVGDVILYHNPSNILKVTAHRVAEILNDDPRIIRTKGDNNPASIPGTDFPITVTEYIDKVSYVIHNGGYIVNPITAISLTIIIFAVPIVLLIWRSKMKISNIDKS